MPSTKCEGLSYPTYFKKCRGSVIKNNFLEYRTKQSTFLHDKPFPTIKAKQILNRQFCAPVVT